MFKIGDRVDISQCPDSLLYEDADRPSGPCYGTVVAIEASWGSFDIYIKLDHTKDVVWTGLHSLNGRNIKKAQNINYERIS